MCQSSKINHTSSHLNSISDEKKVKRQQGERDEEKNEIDRQEKKKEQKMGQNHSPKITNCAGTYVRTRVSILAWFSSGYIYIYRLSDMLLQMSPKAWLIINPPTHLYSCCTASSTYLLWFCSAREDIVPKTLFPSAFDIPETYRSATETDACTSLESGFCG